jgi:Cu2+-exporting ATPase
MRTSGAIKKLLKLAPTEATLVKRWRRKKLFLFTTSIRRYYRVKPGEEIPLTEKITEGNSSINESMISVNQFCR